MACRQLGFPLGAIRFTRESEFGSVSADFALDNVYCDGNETSLLDCDHLTTREDCGPSEGAGVVCHPNDDTTLSPPSSTIELVGGNSPNEGNLMITRPDGFRGPVCDDSFSGFEGIAQVISNI